MSDASIEDAVIEQLERLGEPDRRRVLDYARSLSVRAPKGVSGISLLPYVGSLPETDAASIAAAIEDGSGRATRTSMRSTN